MKLLSAFVPFALLISCGREPASTKTTKTSVSATEVETFTPQAGDRYSASIVPHRTVNLSFPLNGVVESVLRVRGVDGITRELQAGDIVAEGSVLAQLRERDHQFQVLQATNQLDEAQKSEAAARAQVAQAEALADKAAKDYQRAEFLLQAKSLTRPDFESAKAQYDSSRAQVDAARAQAEAVTTRIATAQAAIRSVVVSGEDNSLRAPIAGVIVQRNIETGSVTGPSAPAFVIAEVSSVKALFGVPDLVVATIKTGARLSLEVETFPGQHFQGFISGVAPVADSGTRLFQIEVTIPNQRGVLRPGMIAALSLAAASRTALPVVPLSAITRVPQNASEFSVLVLDGRIAHRRIVTLGETYGDKVQITAGVKAGEKVISRGANAVEEGESVEVIP